MATQSHKNPRDLANASRQILDSQAHKGAAAKIAEFSDRLGRARTMAHVTRLKAETFSFFDSLKNTNLPVYQGFRSEETSLLQRIKEKMGMLVFFDKTLLGGRKDGTA